MQLRLCSFFTQGCANSEDFALKGSEYCISWFKLGSLIFQRLGLFWTGCTETFIFTFFLHFKTSPRLLKSLWSSRNVLWTTKLHHDFTSAWRWVDNDWILYFFGWTFPLTSFPIGHQYILNICAKIYCWQSWYPFRMRLINTVYLLCLGFCVWKPLSSL